MQIRLIAIGQKMPAWITAGFNEYRKRLVHPIRFELVEIQAEKGLTQSHVTMIEREGQRLLANIKPHHKVVALDQRGQSWSTEQLSHAMQQWLMNGYQLDLIVGGPDGLSPACLNRADQQWSLSPLTLPHPLVRVLIVEQLYRAQSILHGHPYHR